MPPGGATGAGKHIWAVKLEELMDLYRVNKFPWKQLQSSSPNLFN